MSLIEGEVKVVFTERNTRATVTIFIDEVNERNKQALKLINGERGYLSAVPPTISASAERTLSAALDDAARAIAEAIQRSADVELKEGALGPAQHDLLQEDDGDA